jgi:diacylglycerol kinase family enzyme
MSRDTFVWSMTNVPTGTASQFSVTIHLPRIEGTQPEIGSAKWC